MVLAGRSDAALYRALPSHRVAGRALRAVHDHRPRRVFGVVDGLSEHDRDVKTITTGMIALVVGFGFWWIYFDLVGRRPPRAGGTAMASWLLSHLPITLSITAAGAAIVGLIGHAHDADTPAGTAWLLSGAVALGLIALIVAERSLADAERSLADAERLDVVYRPLRPALAAGAGAVAPRTAARVHAQRALVLRGQPVHERRRVRRGTFGPRRRGLGHRSALSGQRDGVAAPGLPGRRAVHPRRPDRFRPYCASKTAWQSNSRSPLRPPPHYSRYWFGCEEPVIAGIGG
jgi:Bacterial low temperature requirement A protein (LtrA)